MRTKMRTKNNTECSLKSSLRQSGVLFLKSKIEEVADEYDQ